jgi:hypothetical protein
MIAMAGALASPIIRPKLTAPLMDVVLITNCTELAEQKLPGLNHTTTLIAGQKIATSLGELVAVQ